MTITRYGIKFQNLHGDQSTTGGSAPPIEKSAAIRVMEQRTDYTNFGIIFDVASHHNSICWGSLNDQANIRSLYIKSDGILYTNIGGNEQAVGGGGSVDGGFGIDFVDPIVSTESYNIFNQTEAITVTNSVTETTLIGNGTGFAGDGNLDLQFSSNYFQVGTTIRITARGIYSSAAVPGNLNIRVKLGTTELNTTGNQPLPAGASNMFWQLNADFTCFVDGDSGEIMSNGAFTFADGITSYQNLWSMQNTSTISIDTTVQQLLDLTAQFDTADSDNSITLQTLVVEKIQNFPIA